MSIPEIIKNAGNLFSDESIEVLGEESDELRDQFDRMRDHFERRQADLKDESSADDVGFYFLGRALHILGFTHSHGEELPGDGARVDYTLFENSDEFLAHVEGRGGNHFFTGAVAVLKLLDWSANLDGEEEQEGVDPPAFVLDDILRQTGLQWAILTNGKIWRLYHRNTAGMMNTYYEAHLEEILRTADFTAYKYFGSIFARTGLASDMATGSCFARSLLA